MAVEFRTTVAATSFSAVGGTNQIINSNWIVPFSAAANGHFDYSFLDVFATMTWDPTTITAPQFAFQDSLSFGFGSVTAQNLTKATNGKFNGGTVHWSATNFSGQAGIKGLIDRFNLNLGQPYTVSVEGNVNSVNLVVNSVIMQMTPGIAPVVQPVPPVKIKQVAPNLYFETLLPPPLDLQPGPLPVTYPSHPIGPGFTNTEFLPSGSVLLSPDLAGVPLAAPVSSGRGGLLMSCMRRKGGVYAFISGAQVIPAIYCVNLPGDAEYLDFSPGLVNSGGSSGQANYGYRIYRGLNGFAPGAWVTGYKALPQAPDYVGAATLANLIPWQGTMQFCVEIYGIANLPAASLADFTVQGLDT